LSHSFAGFLLPKVGNHVPAGAARILASGFLRCRKLPCEARWIISRLAPARDTAELEMHRTLEAIGERNCLPSCVVNVDAATDLDFNPNATHAYIPVVAVSFR
jgi:hypothetical protein